MAEFKIKGDKEGRKKYICILQRENMTLSLFFFFFLISMSFGISVIEKRNNLSERKFLSDK